MKVRHGEHAVWLILLVAAGLLAGCGGQPQQEPVDAAALLERYESQGQKHDPVNFVEVDLGEFLVSKPLGDPVDLVFVRCHLYAVTARRDEAELNELLAQRRTRMRDTIISAIQKMEPKALAEPGMGWMKSELTLAVNRALRTRAVRDIAFSEFSLEKG